MPKNLYIGFAIIALLAALGLWLRGPFLSGADLPMVAALLVILAALVAPVCIRLARR